jgi:hypothetical protein
MRRHQKPGCGQGQPVKNSVYQWQKQKRNEESEVEAYGSFGYYAEQIAKLHK